MRRDSGLAGSPPQGGLPWHGLAFALPLCWAFWLQACTPNSLGGTPPGGVASQSKAAAPPASTALARSSPEPAELGTPEWQDAVRGAAWQEVLRLTERLGQSARQHPHVRFVRARAALESGAYDVSLQELAGLEEALPLLAGEIALYRAQAQLEVGPFDAAARFFESRAEASNLVQAVRAYERGGQLDRARAVADRAVARSASKRSERWEATSRALRARIAERQGDERTSVADYRWLAVRVPASEDARGADLRLAELSPIQALTAGERAQRALVLARHGLVPETDAELDLAGKARGTRPTEADACYARGLARYTARSDLEGAYSWLMQAAALGSKQRIPALFYAARARARAHRDEEAIELYLELARRHPESSWAEESRFRAAELWYILGRWDRAVAAYGSYLQRYGRRGRFVETARYERAVAWLAAGKYAQAARALQGLVAAKAEDAFREAHYRELYGVALSGSGRQDQARLEFGRVIRERPLTFAALLAASRLRGAGQDGEALIGPPAPDRPGAALAVALPPKVLLLHQMGLDGDAEAELMRHEGAQRERHGARGNEALCQAYSVLSTAARRYRVGQRAAGYTLLCAAPSPGTRWLWDCVYPRPYPSLVESALRQTTVSADLAYAVMRQESGFDPNVASSAQAVGLMQLIPPTAANVARELGLQHMPEQLKSPGHNLRLGSHYLHKLLGTFGGNVVLATAAYNAGPAAVSRWLASAEHLPLDVFVARIPYAETRAYVHHVMTNLARYAFLRGGVPAVVLPDLELPQKLRADADAY